MDADAYGHVNNVEYYSYFDTAVTADMIGHAGLDPHTSPVIRLVIEIKCVLQKIVNVSGRGQCRSESRLYGPEQRAV